MAKKKNENTLSYLQMPLPSGGKYSKMTKVSFGGLNKRHEIDSGELSMASNISTKEYPYLTPSDKMTNVLSAHERPISMFGFDDFLIVVYGEGDTIKIDYITQIDTAEPEIYTGVLKTIGGADDNEQRSIVQFNVYDTPTDPLTGQYIKKLLIFPDKVSMFMKIVKTSSNPENWTENDYKEKDLSVMYCYEKDDIKHYYTVIAVQKTEGDEGYDKDRVTYKRLLKKKNVAEIMNEDGEAEEVTLENEFFCDEMTAMIKDYENDTYEIDESGAKIYPPPDTASHNCYYRNTANILGTNNGTDIYKWCEYATAVEDEDGNWIPDGGTTYGWKVCVPPTMPNIKHATVHLSRVFGVDDDRVYASGFNDYANWNLDTIDEYNEANAWCSPSQSNTKAGGNFTGITTFQGHVICFKHDFMHEIYNTKNPFRLQDIYGEGAIDNRTIQDVDGKLIFVSEDDVKVYTGSNPRIIGYKLNMPKYTYAVSGTDNRNYYLYCEDHYGDRHIYVYDTYTDLWSERSVQSRVLSFAHNKSGMYMICTNGVIYKLDSGKYLLHPWSFETELITNKTVNIKHIKKLQMLVDIPEKINDVENSSASFQTYILYDNEVFEDMTSEEKKNRFVCSGGGRRGRIPIRVKPRKTANYGFKLHIEGKGYFKLHELEIFIESGGDMYV